MGPRRAKGYARVNNGGTTGSGFCFDCVIYLHDQQTRRESNNGKRADSAGAVPGFMKLDVADWKLLPGPATVCNSGTAIQCKKRLLSAILQQFPKIP